ncbi:hypothetical protein SAMN05216214_108177 [Atopomonas hussainii]|uniref:Uncharacterized protein n=1 Tax=Atopomonas hussainii TaxID=1429083 RepID=A0A1H7MTK8_9GAMM|nr:hypothetical protein SAMN05216214_108177 [Atopomonas hussainii]
MGSVYGAFCAMHTKDGIDQWLLQHGEKTFLQMRAVLPAVVHLPGGGFR